MPLDAFAPRFENASISARMTKHPVRRLAFLSNCTMRIVSINTDTHEINLQDSIVISLRMIAADTLWPSGNTMLAVCRTNQA